jgi:hypothetical protein
MSSDLHKTYVDDEHYNSGHGHAYKSYGVDPNVGAVVIVRPDQCECLMDRIRQDLLTGRRRIQSNDVK